MQSRRLVEAKAGGCWPARVPGRPVCFFPAFRLFLQFILLGFAVVWVSAVESDPGPENAARLSVAVEALNRLKGMDLEANPGLKAAVQKIIESTKGTPQFVELIREFKVKGKERELMEFAVENSNQSAGAEAARLVLASEDNSVVGQALAGTNALKAIEVLGNTGQKEAVPFLLPLLRVHATNSDSLRLLVRGLAQTRAGAEALLERVPSGGDEFKALVAGELMRGRWPEIEAAAHQLLPARDDVLPPISELAQKKGDATRGAEVFRREQTGCSKCHQIRGQGVDFGPSLSEIGTKLAKEAIYEAILDPSAGISFGYEGWALELKNGDEPFGLVASETADELAIKAQGGIVTRYKKSDIVKRTQQRTSVMPVGLAQTMSTQDLIDLVEYLSTLRGNAAGQGKL